MWAAYGDVPLFAQVAIVPIGLIVLAFVRHILQQLVFVNKNEPPLVFSWIPFFGSTVEYGIDPYKFYFKYQKIHGNTFSFILIGRKHTVCLGTEGNNFVLNGSQNEISAADIYRGITVPVFGKDVCYDCSPAKFMEQKKACETLLKYSLTTEKLESYVPIFLNEVQGYITNAESFQGEKGVFDVVESIAIMTIFTAAASLQGKEVRDHFHGEMAGLYHDLDKSFIPINFYIPGLPLPVNRRRDQAQKKIAAIYRSIIKARRELGEKSKADDDMIWNLMGSTYKDGNPVPDHEIANIMIGLLMAGQHNSYSVASWILFHIADRLDIQETLFQEQLVAFGSDLDTSSSHGIINRLPLHKMVVQETLRMHDPIHTVMRAIKAPLTIVSHHQPTLLDHVYRIPTSHILVAAPGITARSEEFFSDPTKWDPYRWETISDVLSSSEKVITGQTPLSKGSASFFLPFGAGRHRCVGETFSYLQLSVMIAYLIRNFKFRPLPGAEFPKPDYSAMITRPILPARLRWERRVKI